MAKKSNNGKGEEVFLIDGNSLAYRAFFALPESIATADGRPTNAIYGFASMMAKILIDHSPKAVIVAWDKETKDKRTDKKWMDEHLMDKVSNLMIPMPLPAVGAKVKVTGTYASTFSSSTGLAADPNHGILRYESLEYLEQAPELANLPTMKERKKDK